MPFKRAWLADARPARRTLWRGVEAQHRVATMRLVDDSEEQALLEQLIEDSKPPLLPGSEEAHWLLFTPFRYTSPWPSRFRRPHEPGAWYGADTPVTVAAELAYWRWRFLADSEGLQSRQVITELTFFQARFAGLELDITQPPWSRHRKTWRSDDYTQCHLLAAQAREGRDEQPPVQAIRYESARREGGLCGVVFDPAALARDVAPNVAGVQQTWTCKVTATRVLIAHEDDILQFEMGGA